MHADYEPAQAPGSIVTLRAGGPFDGVVRIVPVTDGHGRTRVEAAWTEDGRARSDSVETETYEDALIIGHEAAEDLAAGHAPSLERD